MNAPSTPLLVLTTPDPASLNARMSATPAGMAFAAGTGPDGKTCRECKHWQRVKHHRYDDEHELKPRPCGEYTRLMRATRVEIVGDDVPHNACACRHFDQQAEPQQVYDPAWLLSEARRERRKARDARRAVKL